MSKAEEVKKIEKKVRKGGQLSKEDLEMVKPVSGELLFGYNEQTRLQKLKEVEAILQKEVDAITKKVTQVQEAAKRARGNEEKAKIQKLYQTLSAERNQILKTQDENRGFVKNKLQPPPVIEEVEANVLQPKVNADLKEN